MRGFGGNPSGFGEAFRAYRQAMRGRRLILVVMCAGLFLVQLDVSIVNVALPSIRDDLQPSAAGLQWVVDGYAIALASLMLAGGTTGDLYGHRRVVLTGLGVFGVASLLAGIAPSPGVLVGARVLQGPAPRCCCPARWRSSRTRSPSRARAPGRSAC